ncbi:MAG: methionine adenosyltransferase [Oscillospiraceae bacterium]|nr:methionine adenosyltransferase [Candidatus Equicaccousia limihippi]
MSKYLFTSESVTEGHPDKVCDMISDAILCAYLQKDPNSRVACECFCTTGIINVMGEITSNAEIDIEKIVRDTVCAIGYDNDEACFNGKTCKVEVNLDRQSPDIALGVDNSLENKSGKVDKYDQIGAGDQGMMFGYACTETENYMPLTIVLAHRLSQELTKVRKNGTLDYLLPDGKSQVTALYQDGVAVKIDTVVVSAQHKASVSLEKLREDIKREVIEKIIPQNLMDDTTKIFINPTGRFVIGGPMGDTGLTGRKIIVDTYGGVARHGGGAFSGKDPTKVDRSAAYAARYAAKNLVAAGLAKRCEIQLSYAIGVAKPVSVTVETFGTGKYDSEILSKAVETVFDLRPAAIIDKLDLRKPIYKDLAAYGQIGREELGLAFEKTDKVQELLDFVAKNA